VIIAPSFADIFFNNCFKTGMLPIVLERAEIDYFFSLDPDNYVEVNLMEQTLSTDKKIVNFKIDLMKRRMLLEGTDEIDYTLQLEDSITDYEKKYDR
jgi:3-isopropylmalate/(R)-2-methylmalate dehydratase small subunit